MAKRFELPVWIREGSEVNKLSNAFGDFWDKAETWIKTPLNQRDAETCHVYVLQLLAYQSDIDRFADEPDDLFRKRVKFAVKNARDAGSKNGFKSILERFDIPLYGQIERDPEKEWDVITLWLADSTLTQNPELGQHIVQKYGRTCRRYEFLLVDGLPETEINATSTSLDKQNNVLTPQPDWVFEDAVDSFSVFTASNVLEKQTSKVNELPAFIFSDDVDGMAMTFFSSSVERHTDTIKIEE